MNDKTFTGWAFTTMFVLAFIYMGALSSALEGWDTAFTIFSWLGMAVMVIATVACLIATFTPRGE